MSHILVGTPPITPSAANASSLVLRSTPGGVDFIQANTAATPGWVLLRDAITEAADGAVTPVLGWQVAANSTFQIAFDPPLRMVNGAVVTFSTTGPLTQTKSATCWFGGRIV